MTVSAYLFLALALVPAAAAVAAPVLTVSAAQQRQLGIRTIVVQPAGAAPIATLPATIAPPPGARVAVSAPFPGVIRQSFAVSGQAVRKGEALASVFSREVLEMGAELTRARARGGVAKSAAARTDQLVREGIAAGARAEEARAALKEADADVSSRSRLLGLANADPATGLYVLRAPIAGRVSSTTVQIGSAIDGMAAPFIIDAARRYAVEAQLPERLVGQVRVGDRIGLAGGVTGTVTSVGVTIDPQTRSALLKASVPAAPGLVTGRSISVALFGPAVAGAVTIPASAIARIGGRTIVFTQAANGFAIRPVTLVSAGGTSAVVTGLPAGARVVTSGVSELKAMGLAAPAGN
ncbi:efflux RND transporter periplasmic adaptor subunit [Polymorphobacter fuscus]|uniref:Efflux RND transporter periplasmic adaptor subunit n=1 Tax=Sandarakinorhabdus fusca TaxID=1439888 RepID=A0A7C9GQW7_9SPHN|nr:efflux RND transporter periplasmic adaptor subunit [Polymorphobacter fuscus]KAB7643876.1 efflux RND transporter periplasmic adaptor subunit [Polymorphobacter fuscus]MQT18577.1 efflux RND transporter periplasmic adaptor subunit [Polymorphobacter fuscus]NJC07056.1 cobalt-zinc-cadmium efflux system membrane fusion protein [Polymorphobacter fuscus]